VDEMTNKCRGCGAEVIWIRTTANRRKMPVDAEPVWILPEGRDSFVTKAGSIIFGRKIGDAWDDDQDANVIQAYESHFATCPVGGQFRNRAPRTRAPGYR
jgi:hypothetical protein